MIAFVNNFNRPAEWIQIILFYFTQACIARNHVSLYHNHHEFYMILCTTDQDTWKTNPLAQVVQCVNEVNDEVPDADTANALTACAAKDNVEGNGYLDEVLAATDGLYPEITPGIFLNI